MVEWELSVQHFQGSMLACVYICTGNCITDLHLTLENSVEAILHSSFDAAHLYLQYQSIIFLHCLAIQSSSVGSVCLSSCLMFLVLSRVICTQSVSLHQSVINDKSHPAFDHWHGKSLLSSLSHSIILELQIEMARLTMVINHAAGNIPS
jgi:hypothetical protein